MTILVGPAINYKRARVDKVEGRKIYVHMLEECEDKVIFISEIIGLELSDDVTIFFTVTETLFEGR